jgi:hypothetical protein
MWNNAAMVLVAAAGSRQIGSSDVWINRTSDKQETTTIR